MASDALDTWELGQVLTNVMPMLILTTLSVSLLVLSPWGIDLLYSGLTHFFTFWPLLLLAILTYITYVKLAEEEKEVPS